MSQTFRLTLSALALAAFAGLAAVPASAEDSMKTEPMKSDSMAADPMKADCMAKADAETDAMKKKDMAAACDTMGTDAMQSGTMQSGTMAAPKK